MTGGERRQFPITYVYWKTQSALYDRYMSQAEALLVAEQITKLPDLLEASTGV
jgi:hypothetical protein